MSNRAPSISPQPARSDERTARIHWPAGSGHPAVNCMVSVRRLDDGTPVLEVYYADTTIKVVMDPELQLDRDGVVVAVNEAGNSMAVLR